MFFVPAFAQAPSPLIPDGSAMAACPTDMPRVLLNPLEDGSVITAGGRNLRFPKAEVYKDIEPKIGQAALKFSMIADFGGVTGDFVLSNRPPGHIQYLGAWVYLASDGNVDKVGFQVKDIADRVLSATVPANWQGWKWVEVDLQKDTFAQQDGKTEKPAPPLQAVDFIWTVKQKGPSFLGVDGLAAVAKADPGDKPYYVEVINHGSGEANTPFNGQLVVNNFSAKPVDLDVTYSLQDNPTLYDKPLPDPVLGADRATGCKSWVEVEGKRVDNGTLTDGEVSTNYGSDWINDHFLEGFQYVDLGQERKIVHMEFIGDGGKMHKLDISASSDGNDYTPVDGLQGITLEKKWGWVPINVPTPFTARYLKLRYHNDGQKMNFVTMLAELRVFDGAKSEEVVIPHVGDQVDQKTVHVTVPPDSYSLTQLTSSAPLKTGGYYFGVTTKGPSGQDLSASYYFVRPEGEIKISPEGRFGMNTAVPDYGPELKRMGISWVRFENMKWMFYNPAPGDFRFDGTVAPWDVPLDVCMEDYHDMGLSILPMPTHAPDWASSAGSEVPPGRRAFYPPKDYGDWEKAMFELAARYGSTKHSADELHTPDKKSGLGWITNYEIWNEPNNPPEWGSWVAGFKKFHDFYRAGAEGIKRGDPNSKIASAGFSGLSMEFIDQLRTYKYSDGKDPLDFTDILSVHSYTGRQEPEYAVDDPNSNRDGRAPGTKTYEQYLIELSDWRDALKPALTIWLTEIGNDVGGPIGRSERYQAAKLPRETMIALASGVEKVFLYREAGSNESMHEGSGLFRNDKSIRPSYFTMATLTRQLDGVTGLHTLRLKTADPKVWLYNWKRPNDYVLTAWTPEDTEPLGLDLGKCHVVDAFGKAKDVEITKDFPLSIFPVYITQITNHAPIDALQKEATDRETQRKKDLAFLMNKGHLYLYAFGSHDNNSATMTYGIPRPVVPVIANDAYDASKGYGFVGKDGKDEWTPWVSNNAIEKGSVAFPDPDGFQFQIDAAPGVYHLELKTRDVAKDAKLTVSGVKEGDLSVSMDANPMKAQFTVTPGQPLVIKVPGNVKVQWLTVVEAAPQ